MRRRSKAGGESPKAHRRKIAARKSRNAPKTVRPRSPSIASLEAQVARLTSELKEALEQKKAASEVLQVISGSAADLQAVFGTLLETAMYLCGSNIAAIWRSDGKAFKLAVSRGVSTEFEKFATANPITPGLGTITGRTALRGKTVHVPDVLADRDFATDYQSRANYRSALGVPLLRQGETIGVFTLTRSNVQAYTESQIELVENFAAQAVIAIENARLLSELRQRTDDLSKRTTDLTELLEQQTATAEVLSVISSSPGELGPVFQAMLENAIRICDAKFGNIYRWDGEFLHLLAAHNTPPALAEARKGSPLRPSLIHRTLATKTATHIVDVAADPDYVERRAPGSVAAVELGGVRTFLSVPMLKENEMIGSFSLYRERVRPFSDKQIELVTNFASQAVIAIENARLLSELRELLDQQTATSKVLDVISCSAFDLKAVFEAVAESSVRLCGADRAFIYRFDGDVLRMAVAFNVPPEFKEYVEQNSIRPGRHTCAARTALERQTIHIPDIFADPEYTFGSKAFDKIRTVLGVPILKGVDLLGVILIYHQEVKPFTDNQIGLVEIFADQAAIAIENGRLLDTLRQRTDELDRSVGELQALSEVSQAVNSTLDLETVLSTIVTKAVQLSGTEAGAIYVFDHRQREFHLRATYGMDKELIAALANQHIGLDEPSVALVFAQREPIQFSDLKSDVHTEVNAITLRAGFRARLMAPLTRGDDVVGMLVVRRRAPGAFAQNTVNLIKTFAAQSAVTIENARLFQSVETSLENLRNTQDRLVQTQKLASLGQLTAGIAHEIKNPLNFVNNFSGVSTELLDELQESIGKVGADPKTLAEIWELTNTLRGNLDKIVQHGKRADSIVKNMLLHSREGLGEHRVVDMNSLVEENSQSCLPWGTSGKAKFQHHSAAVVGPGSRRSGGLPARDHTGSAQPDLKRLLRSY